VLKYIYHLKHGDTSKDARTFNITGEYDSRIAQNLCYKLIEK